MFELVENLTPNAMIKVIGVGGGGGNRRARGREDLDLAGLALLGLGGDSHRGQHHSGEGSFRQHVHGLGSLKCNCDGYWSWAPRAGFNGPDGNRGFSMPDAKGSKAR